MPHANEQAAASHSTVTSALQIEVRPPGQSAAKSEMVSLKVEPDSKAVVKGGHQDPRFPYMLLSRLKADCEFYLGFGARNAKRLWAQNESRQIQKMKELYAALPEKPVWITLADISRYEQEMVTGIHHTL